MLTQSSGITLESQEFNSLDTCTAAETMLHKKFAVAADWSKYAVSVMTSCTEK